MVYESTGRYQKALEFYKQALLICKEIRDRFGEGVTLNNIGRVYNSFKQYTEALRFYQQALVISKEVGKQAGEGIIFNNSWIPLN